MIRLEFFINLAIDYWVPVLFGSLAGVVTYMWRTLKAFKIGILIVLQNSLLEIYYTWIDQEYVPVSVMERVTKTYEAYHTLGGNGVGTKVFKELNDLPSAQPESAKLKLKSQESEVCNSCLKTIPDRDRISL